MSPVELTSSAAVEAALLDPRLVPPPADSLRPGATADLRQAMARFSPPETHGPRRAAVAELLAAIDHHPFAADAARRARAIVEAIGSARPVDGAADLGDVVPVEVVALALGVGEPELPSVRADVLAVVKVIGRRQPATDEADAATMRLTDRLGELGHDPVAAVSLLYQTHDATAQLVAAMLIADAANAPRSPAVAATVRIVATATVVGEQELTAGTAVSLNLASSGFEYGLGAHACPGRGVAERIALGILGVVRDAEVEVGER